jgi:hypothetical protein
MFRVLSKLLVKSFANTKRQPLRPTPRLSLQVEALKERSLLNAAFLLSHSMPVHLSQSDAIVHLQPIDGEVHVFGFSGQNIGFGTIWQLLPPATDGSAAAGSGNNTGLLVGGGDSGTSSDPLPLSGGATGSGSNTGLLTTSGSGVLGSGMGDSGADTTVADSRQEIIVLGIGLHHGGVEVFRTGGRVLNSRA